MLTIYWYFCITQKTFTKFQENRNFALLTKNSIFWLKIMILKFFRNFSVFFFFNLKRELNCHYLAKKIIEIGPIVLEISYFEEKNHQKLGSESLFSTLGHTNGPQFFVFMCYFCSVIRSKEFDISQGVFTLHFWKIEFFLPYFALLPVFTKSATGRKQVVIEKNLCDFRL